MNAIQKRFPVVALTVLLILFACGPLYGQVYRYVSYFDSAPNLHTLYALADCDSNCSWANATLTPSSSSGSALAVDNHNGGAQIFYVTNNEIEDYSNVDTAGTWYSTCVTCAAGAPEPAAGSALTSFIDYSGYITHVFYEGTNGNVYL